MFLFFIWAIEFFLNKIFQNTVPTTHRYKVSLSYIGIKLLGKHNGPPILYPWSTFIIYFWLRFMFVYQKSLKQTFKTGFEYKITFWICGLVLGIHKGYYVVKKLVWNVPIKAFLYTKYNILQICGFNSTYF